MVSAFESEAPPIVKNANFKSAKDGDWNDPNTWDPIGVPASGDPVQILGNASGGPHTILVKGDQTCGNLTIDAGGRLELDTTAPGSSLTLDDGAVLDNDSEIRYVGDNTANATLSSAGTAVYSPTASAILDWNNLSKCQYGNFIHLYQTFLV
ncbi:unnamed protein product, partial [marine sediment metagenome]